MSLPIPARPTRWITLRDDSGAMHWIPIGQVLEVRPTSRTVQGRFAPAHTPVAIVVVGLSWLLAEEIRCSGADAQMVLDLWDALGKARAA